LTELEALVQDKWNEMKKKTKIIGESNRPWFECFNNIFSSIAKISGKPNAIDQGVRVMNFEIEVVNVSDEEDVQTPQMPNSLQNKLLCLVTMQMLELPHILILKVQKLRHASYLVCKGNLIRS